MSDPGSSRHRMHELARKIDAFAAEREPTPIGDKAVIAAYRKALVGLIEAWHPMECSVCEARDGCWIDDQYGGCPECIADALYAKAEKEL